MQYLFRAEYRGRTAYTDSLLRHAPADQIAFFDIETTGLDPSRTQMTVGGLAWVERGRIKLEQYFVPAPDDEGPVLREFLDRLADFTCLCPYNGDSFDIPFLRGRARRLGVQTPFGEVISVDWLPSPRMVVAAQLSQLPAGNDPGAPGAGAAGPRRRARSCEDVSRLASHRRRELAGPDSPT